MRRGSSIIGTTSVNSDTPTPHLLPYDVTKAGIANMVGALAGMLAERGIRANSVAPGPIWTPLIPSTMPAEQVATFGSSVPLNRPGRLHLRRPGGGHRGQARSVSAEQRARAQTTRLLGGERAALSCSTIAARPLRSSRPERAIVRSGEARR